MRPPPSVATYRLQLTPRFGFDDVRRLLPYLNRLGVDAVYLSPLLASRRGSLHGYDGIDPRRVDPARGGPAGFARLVRALRRHGLGLVVDFVPNHLAADVENRAWASVLRDGPGARWAGLFDIDWNRGPGGPDTVAVPWLDRPLDASFRDATVAFEPRGRHVVLRCGPTDLPLAPRAEERLGRSIRPGQRAERPPPGRRRLAALLAEVNAGRSPAARRLRRRLLRDQWYRLVPWRRSEAINYRRFFDISDLVGVRPETDDGFRYLHTWLARAVRSRAVQGIRLDHIDGLADPLGYLRRLDRKVRADARAANTRPPALYVEKILAYDETLPSAWPVAGTTGYEALVRITGVLVPEGAGPGLDAAYRRVVPGGVPDFAPVAWRSKRDVERRLFGPERRALLDRLLDGAPSAPPRAGLDRALGALTAGLGVYRTYAVRGRFSAADRARLRHAVAEARRRAPAITASRAFRWLDDLVLGPLPRTAADRARRAAFLERWQQWTGAVAAKGIEDTAFYRYVRFVGANEVGGDPGRTGLSLGAFHAFMRERARAHPRSLTPLSTHDSKWGEDARARLLAWTEYRAPWGRSVARWRALGRPLRRGIPVADRPTPREEYRLYQALVASAPSRGTWSPGYLARLGSYAVKAAREAKETSSWRRPNRRREAAVLRLLRSLGRDPRARRIRSEVEEWVRRLARVGAYYSLAQTVLQVTVPGIPDLYQGSEGGTLALVDPDNRRPVRFRRLAQRLARPPRPGGRPAPVETPTGASFKVHALARLLALRRQHPAVFLDGSYEALPERGPAGGSRCVAFARRHRDEWVVTIVGRELGAALDRGAGGPPGAAWAGRSIRLPAGAPTVWREWLTDRVVSATRGPRGAELALSDVFAELPVAVLQAPAGATPPRRRGGNRPKGRKRKDG